ncbi:HotDog domain-containing protein [Aspergillus caelatus]|uniref:HotDog domain-containing protein n=2 Tax=Aspergillus subgen. Circumdati TaxID=2720871 RepID=A0A5N6ZQE3_9EURO|nr:HotDog domain-containing protein [Aspergillus caelatus]KAE8359862.1 HotDog domain-containing protein [Aspergillus caelatus]KAE8412663.1 HotDog domain-containing protein [Aspergillus pseudocaelatus]
MPVRAPARKLDEFEDLVYQYSNGMNRQDDEERWDIDSAAADLRFESATQGPPARVSFLLNVTPKMCNPVGTLHGGCAATLIDILSTTLLLGLSKPGYFSFGGVSRNLRVTYLRPLPKGLEIRLVCELIHTGKRLALMRAEIQRADNGAVCVVGEHEKANTDPEADGRI